VEKKIPLIAYSKYVQNMFFFQFEQFTPCVFTYLQTYAVGMEEVAWDSKKWKTKGKFNRERGFLEVNLRLRSVSQPSRSIIHISFYVIFTLKLPGFLFF